MTTISDWDNEYARLARAASQLRTSGLSTNDGLGATLPQALQRLERQLDGLHTLPTTEMQRRRRLVQNLQEQQRGGGYQPPTSAGSDSLQQQSQVTLAMRQQDQMIDELASGMGRLKNQTTAINEEARMHVNLMNNMEENMDAAHAGLENETRRAARLREDASIWRLQLSVAGLSVLLVLLIVMGRAP